MNSYDKRNSGITKDENFYEEDEIDYDLDSEIEDSLLRTIEEKEKIWEQTDPEEIGLKFGYDHREIFPYKENTRVELTIWRDGVKVGFFKGKNKLFEIGTTNDLSAQKIIKILDIIIED